jgi:hypothetical protein
MDLFELNRKVDRLLFDALPDKPEHAFERADSTNTNVLNRSTMQSLNQNKNSFLNESNSKTIGITKFDSKKNKIVFTPSYDLVVKPQVINKLKK